VNWRNGWVVEIDDDEVSGTTNFYPTESIGLTKCSCSTSACHFDCVFRLKSHGVEMVNLLKENGHFHCFEEVLSII
jgi:hypothetical protein